MSGRPFYIYVPTLRERSAGIRVLLKLCGELIALGHRAYVALPSSRGKSAFSGTVQLPILSTAQILADRNAGLAPIAVYPEIVFGNPLNGAIVARYIMNWPGKLGGPSIFEESDHLFCYTKTLTDNIPESMTMNIQVVDQTIFYEKNIAVRTGSCSYAGKYRRLGGVPKGMPDNCVEIFIDGSNIQSPSQIAALFARCEVLYLFEDSLLGLEAALCGCPCVFVPNEIFSTPFGDEEFGISTVSISDPEHIASARANIPKVKAAYLRLLANEKVDINRFASFLQNVDAGGSLRLANLIIAKSSGEFPIRDIMNCLGVLLREQGMVAGFRIAWEEWQKIEVKLTSDNRRRLGFSIRGRYRD